MDFCISLQFAIFVARIIKKATRLTTSIAFFLGCFYASEMHMINLSALGNQVSECSDMLTSYLPLFSIILSYPFVLSAELLQ